MQSDQLFDATEFRHVLGHYPTGVCIVAALDGADLTAMVVGSFTSVSLDPPLVAFLPDKRSTSWPRLENAGKFCINILASDQHHVSRQVSKGSADKFAGLSYRLSTSGSPIFDGVLAWIDCRLHATYEAGDHWIVLGEVVALKAEKATSPLLFFRGGYRELLHAEDAHL